MSVDAPVPTLRPEERAGLLELLAATARPLADVVADFFARFPRERRLRVGATLCFLLEDKKMLHPTGRLIAFAILHQSYSSQPVNPYVLLLLNVKIRLFGGCTRHWEDKQYGTVRAAGCIMTEECVGGLGEVLWRLGEGSVNINCLLPWHGEDKQYGMVGAAGCIRAEEVGCVWLL